MVLSNDSTTGADFSYGALGMTHHCVQDIGIMSSVPNINIFHLLISLKWKKYSILNAVSDID